MKIYSQSKFTDLSAITIEVNNNNVIKEITSAILLGVTLDQHLKWDKQVNTIYNIIITLDDICSNVYVAILLF
jgi:hypothetical protein